MSICRYEMFFFSFLYEDKSSSSCSQRLCYLQLRTDKLAREPRDQISVLPDQISTRFFAMHPRICGNLDLLRPQVTITIVCDDTNETSKLRRLSAPLSHFREKCLIATERKTSRQVENCNVHRDSFLMHFDVKLCKLGNSDVLTR